MALNPWRHLGALGFMSFWLLAASGIYLYAFLDTSAAGAYRSIVNLAEQQPWFGGILRSLHRYAADALVILLVAHLLREWLHKHYQGVRRYSWLTGVATIALVFVSAIGGFWLHWDRLGQYSAIATAEWLDALPLLAAPLARNFLSADAVSDRLFSLFVFVHLGVPLLLLFALWFHIQRLTRAAVWPPRNVAAALLASLLLLALIAPVSSHAPANLATVPQALRLDWWLLFIHPLAEFASPLFAWALVGSGFILLLALPFLPQPARAPVAVVDPANCNGCKRCFADCPFAAITMVAHPNQKVGKQMAVVDADLCASCSICVGACPSSTPFRSAAELVTGIDMPQAPINALRKRLQQGIAALREVRPQADDIRRPPPGVRRGPFVALGDEQSSQPTFAHERMLVVFGCERGARVEGLAAPDVAAFSLPCAGQLPPSFVEYALRDGASAVLVSGCSEGGCEYRLGQRWTDERLSGTREPHLRASVPREQVATVWADAGNEAALHTALEGLRRG